MPEAELMPDVGGKTQADVAYRQGDASMNCGACANFKSPTSCALVSGTVASNGVCNLFSPLEQVAGTPNPQDLMAQLFGATGGM